MAYDPYGQLPSDQEQSTLRDIAGQAANPVNWFLLRYQYDPRVWRVWKGLKMPFGAKLSESGFSSTFGSKGLFSESYKSYRGEGLGRIRSFNRTVKETVGGEFFLGEKFFSNTNALQAARGSLRKNLKNSMMEGLTGTNLNFHRRRRIAKGMGSILEEVLDEAGSVTKLTQDEINKRLLDFGKSPYVKKYGLKPDQFAEIARKSGVTPEGLAAITKKAGAENFLGQLNQTGFRVGLRKAARVGLFFGKGFAAYGAITGMWELTKMVGEPIGRYLVENTNRLVQAYQDRYMPEMGGRIALSYMSGGAATERQRAIQAISKSYINGRSAIGHEAEFMHS